MNEFSTKEEKTMFTCQNCQTQFATPGGFCTACGTDMSYQMQQEVIPPERGGEARSYAIPNAYQATAHGLGSIFGLHPAVAFFTLAVNLMMFGKDGVALLLAPITAGSDIPLALLISVGVGALIGYVTYLGQMKWDGDDHESARIKAMITGILTALPTGLPGMLFGSVALAGLLRRERK
jgi:hypothetical protein